MNVGEAQNSNISPAIQGVRFFSFQLVGKKEVRSRLRTVGSTTSESHKKGLHLTQGCL